MECALRDLRYKEVIGMNDGTRYGYVGDLEIDLEEGRVRSLIIPGQPRLFGLLGRKEDIVIPWEEVRRFGEDIILVEGEVRRRLPDGHKNRWR